MNNTNCKVDGCPKPVRYKTAQLCQMHYFRQWRGTDIRGAEPLQRTYTPDATCEIDGCGNRPSSKGLCQMHTTRLRRHGDVNTVKKPTALLGPANPWWSGDEVGYFGMHDRIRKQRGSAKHYLCECGIQAQQWAYDHQDANERVSPVGPYSTDVMHYVPMCVPCHKAMDLAYLSVSPLAA